MADLVAIVLAAGVGKRMKSDMPKVLHVLCGRPMVEYVLDAAREAGATRTLVVVGHGAEDVQSTLAARSDLDYVVQAKQKGTGHAVEMCRPQLEGHSGQVMVIAGDAPLVRSASLKTLVETQSSEGAACVFGTAMVDNPTGLGRIVRGSSGEFQAIVEEKDATEQQRAIHEINPSYYVFQGPELLWALSQMQPSNAQKEYYLTDCPRHLMNDGRRVIALNAMGAEESYGVNTRAQLGELHTILQERIQQHWMDEGVSIVDPRNTYVDSRVVIGKDTVIYPFTFIEGPATIGEGCRIGPFVHVRQGSEISSQSVLESTN